MTLKYVFIDTFDLNMELPGMKKEDIVVSIEDKVLTISDLNTKEND